MITRTPSPSGTKGTVLIRVGPAVQLVQELMVVLDCYLDLKNEMLVFIRLGHNMN